MRRGGIAVGTALLLAAVAAWRLSASRGEGAVAVEDDAEASAPDVGNAALARSGPVVRETAVVAPRGRGAVRGTVRKAGAPCATRIEVHPYGRIGPPLPDSWTSRDASDDFPEGGLFGGVPLATSTSGADGAFRVVGLSPGAYDVVAIAPDGARGAARARLLAEGAEVVADVAIRWGPERLVGRAVRTGGTPWKGKIGAVSVDDGSSLRGCAFADTDDEGRFTIAGLERGRASLVALLDRALHVTTRPIPIPYAAGEYVFVVDDETRDVSGRVLDDRDGRPVPGAVVVARSSGGERTEIAARAVADAEGRFRVLVATLGGGVNASAAGYAAGYRNVESGQEKVEVRLVRLARVHGRVTSEADGAPVAGVGVYAAPVGDSWGEGSRATTGPDGRYEIPDAPGGTLMVAAFGEGWFSRALLEARPSGFNPLCVDAAPDATIAVDLVVARCASATGTVKAADGSAVAGACVAWKAATVSGRSPYEFDWLAAASRVATAADGTFTTSSVLPGLPSSFVATAPDHGVAKAGPFESDPRTPIVADLVFAAPRWLDAGVFEAPRETPLPGATVHVNLPNDLDDRELSAVTGADGHCRVGPLPRGRLWATANGSGLRGAWSQVDADTDDPVVEARFVMQRGYDVRVRLRYPDGTPVTDRAVRLSLTGRDTDWTRDDSSSDATFEFEGLEEGTYRLEVRIDGDSEGPPVAYDNVVAGAPLTTITVPGAPAKLLTLTVLGPDGKPVPHARLLAAGIDTDGFPLDTGHVVEGTVRLPCPTGSASFEILSAETAGGRPAPFAPATLGPVPAGAETAEVRLEPERRIEGRVHGTDGVGIRGVRVRAVPSVRAKAFEGSDEAHDAAFSDADGRFRLGRLWAGEYKLFVEAAGTYAPLEPRVVASGDLRVDVLLSRGLALAVPVEDSTGRPVAEATVTAFLEGRQSVRAKTDAGGVARLVGLDRSRDYTLYVAPADGGDVLGRTIDPWRPSEEPVRLDRAVPLRGVVRDAEGRAVVGARVVYVGPAGESDSMQSGADGEFSFGGLPPGEYRVVAVSRQASSPVVAATAGAQGVALVVEPTKELRVRVDGWRPPEGDVWIPMRLDGTSFVAEWSRLDANGVATFSSLHPETAYAIYLRPYADRSRCIAVRGIRGSAGEVVVAFDPGRTISGRLLVPRGAISLAASIEQEGVSIEASIEDDGRYAFEGLPDGTFTVRAHATLDGASLAGSARVTAGGTADVELRPR